MVQVNIVVTVNLVVQVDLVVTVNLINKVVSKNKIAKKYQNRVDLLSWINNNNFSAGIFTDFVTELKLQETVNLNMLILANKKFELFLRKFNE